MAEFGGRRIWKKGYISFYIMNYQFRWGVRAFGYIWRFEGQGSLVWPLPFLGRIPLPCLHNRLVIVD